MSERTASRLGLRLSAFDVLMSIAALVVIYFCSTAPAPVRPYDVTTGLVEVATTLAFALVGGILTAKRPGNLVGWGLMVAGTGTAVGNLMFAYAYLALLARPEAGLAGGTAVGAIGAGNWAALMAGVFLLLLLFPRGRLPSRRWRFVAPIALAGFAYSWFATATIPGILEAPLDDFESPLAFTDSPLYVATIVATIAVCLLSTAAAAIDLLVRFRRSHGAERQQYKWLAVAAALLVASMPLGAATNYSGTGGIPIGLALIALPIAVGVALLRYRLYDIDRIINRTLVYTFLTATLGALYAGLVFGLQELLRPLSGGSDLAIVITTLTVAALFLPARRRVQDVVDRRFNRRAYDAARTVDAFAARLRRQIDLDTLRYELLTVVNDTMAPSQTSLLLTRRNDLGTS